MSRIFYIMRTYGTEMETPDDFSLDGFQTEDLDTDLRELVVSKVIEPFLKTPEGLTCLKNGDGWFTWSDAINEIPDFFWAAAGIVRIHEPQFEILGVNGDEDASEEIEQILLDAEEDLELREA